ncbi:MAG: Flp pilus assembly protein CpaB [Bacillota bacterium]
MRKRNNGALFLVLAVTLALAAALVATKVIRSFNETTQVVIAARDIAPYTAVVKDDVKVVDYPSAAVPPDAVRNAKDIVGKFLKSQVLVGEPLRMARLADTQTDKSLMSARVSELGRPDVRAFALPWDPQAAVGGDVLNGDRVDVVASVKIDSGTGSIGVGKIVARNVLVLKVFKPSGSDKGSLVVALTPSQIEDIAFTLTSGQLRYALNPFNTDEHAADTPGVTGTSWLLKYGFQPPSKR